MMMKKKRIRVLFEENLGGFWLRLKLGLEIGCGFLKDEVD